MKLFNRSTQSRDKAMKLFNHSKQLRPSFLPAMEETDSCSVATSDGRSKMDTSASCHDPWHPPQLFFKHSAAKSEFEEQRDLIRDLVGWGDVSQTDLFSVLNSDDIPSNAPKPLYLLWDTQEALALYTVIFAAVTIQSVWILMAIPIAFLAYLAHVAILWVDCICESQELRDLVSQSMWYIQFGLEQAEGAIAGDASRQLLMSYGVKFWNGIGKWGFCHLARFQFREINHRIIRQEQALVNVMKRQLRENPPVTDSQYSSHVIILSDAVEIVNDSKRKLT